MYPAHVRSSRSIWRVHILLGSFLPLNYKLAGAGRQDPLAAHCAFLLSNFDVRAPFQPREHLLAPVIEPRHVSLGSTPSIFLVSSFIYLFGRRVLAGLLIVIKRRGVTRTGGAVGRFGIFDGQPRGLMTVVMEYRKWDGENDPPGISSEWIHRHLCFMKRRSMPARTVNVPFALRWCVLSNAVSYRTTNRSHNDNFLPLSSRVCIFHRLHGKLIFQRSLVDTSLFVFDL